MVRRSLLAQSRRFQRLGCVLAEQTHAPHINLIILDCEEYYPFESGSSRTAFSGSARRAGSLFLSGLQIDRRGNVNLHVLGDYAAPSLRMAGAYGSAMLYYMAHRVILFRTEHSRRALVEQVDFVTSPGITPEHVHREGGPTQLITPKAVPCLADRRVAVVRVSTLVAQPKMSRMSRKTQALLWPCPRLSTTTRPPTADELTCLRSQVRAKLSRSYSDFFGHKVRQAS